MVEDEVREFYRALSRFGLVDCAASREDGSGCTEQARSCPYVKGCVGEVERDSAGGSLRRSTITWLEQMLEVLWRCAERAR